ncbi:uncharacterized protein [Euphorbia lathyris]|uniref:uncharacterized protein n=1 Tax=Euphorbia lathyris TaxID=212925 RepID=UPI003313700E
MEVVTSLRTPEESGLQIFSSFFRSKKIGETMAVADQRRRNACLFRRKLPHGRVEFDKVKMGARGNFKNREKKDFPLFLRELFLKTRSWFEDGLRRKKGGKFKYEK